MRAHVNFFVTNQDSDTSQILNVKIEGNKLGTPLDTDNVPYYRALDDAPCKRSRARNLKTTIEI